MLAYGGDPEQNHRLWGPTREDLLKTNLLLSTIRSVADIQCLGQCHSQWPTISSCLKELSPMCPLCQDCPQSSRPRLLAMWTSLSQMVLSWVLLSKSLDSPSQEAVNLDWYCPAPRSASSHTEYLLSLQHGDIPFSRAMCFLPLPTWRSGTHLPLQ